MSQYFDLRFIAALQQEFAVEPRLAQEVMGADMASLLLSTGVACAVGAGVGMFVAASPAVLVSKGITKKLTEKMIGIVPGRAISDLLALWKSDDDNYRSLCRSALCYSMKEDYAQAWRALNNAEHKRSHWARHLHLKGLLHAAEGKYGEAKAELLIAAQREPDSEARARIERAANMIE